jgi:hypothetical protein
LEDPHPTSKKGAAKLFGNLLRKGAKNTPGASEPEKYALDKVSQLVTEAANEPEGVVALPQKKKGILHAVDRFMVRVIAPEVKDRYEQYSDQ